MRNELYIKIAQHTKVNKKKVNLSDIASMHCQNHDVVKELGNTLILTIEGTENGMYAMTVLKVIELIHRKKPELLVVNEGEKDFVIEYMPMSEDNQGKGAKAKNIKMEYIKAVFVAFVSFFGAAFTIMTFNLDVSVGDLFDDIYKWVIGTDKSGAPSILEFSYCVGLPIGIVVFFNHFSRKKLTVDPTPIHVEMRNYEKQINDALIEDASREGKTIDVS